MKILILGGTAEARDLADRLVALGHDVVSSLAGRTQHPLQPAGAVRVGGFGGIDGLADYLRRERFDGLVDATHPSAAVISNNAVAAARASAVPLLRYMRPQWIEPDGAHWLTVADFAGAAASLPRGACVLLTTGQGGLDSFLARDDCRFLVRLIETPADPAPRHARWLVRRPPYDLADEMALLKTEKITHLVSKNSGGGQTAAKLEAAQKLGIRVVMIARPTYAPAQEVASVEAVIAALGLSG